MLQASMVFFSIFGSRHTLGRLWAVWSRRGREEWTTSHFGLSCLRPLYARHIQCGTSDFRPCTHVSRPHPKSSSVGVPYRASRVVGEHRRRVAVLLHSLRRRHGHDDEGYEFRCLQLSGTSLAPQTSGRELHRERWRRKTFVAAASSHSRHMCVGRSIGRRKSTLYTWMKYHGGWFGEGVQPFPLTGVFVARGHFGVLVRSSPSFPTLLVEGQRTPSHRPVVDPCGCARRVLWRSGGTLATDRTSDAGRGRFLHVEVGC